MQQQVQQQSQVQEEQKQPGLPDSISANFNISIAGTSAESASTIAQHGARPNNPGGQNGNTDALPGSSLGAQSENGPISANAGQIQASWTNSKNSTGPANLEKALKNIALAGVDDIAK